MTVDIGEQAKILAHALPYIQNYHGKTVVVKYGGSAMSDEERKAEVMKDVVLLRYVGMRPVLVHGGGPEITEIMARIGKKAKFVNGLRVTDAETMEVAEMVLAGKTNKSIVSLINRQGGLAVGLSGKDSNLLVAEKCMPSGVDLGCVGEIVHINNGIVNILIREGYIPVICSIGVGEDGTSYNINADHAAGDIAASLGAEKLVILTDVQGVYRDVKNPSTLISSLTRKEVEKMISSGEVESGMLPKLEACVKALRGGVEKAHIVNGTTPHALLMEIFTDEGIGTMVS